MLLHTRLFNIAKLNKSIIHLVDFRRGSKYIQYIQPFYTGSGEWPPPSNMDEAKLHGSASANNIDSTAQKTTSTIDSEL